VKKGEVLAKVYRGTTVESVHCGSVVIVDSIGKILYQAGDPYFFTFLRSSAKPFQVLPLIESGAAQEFGFTAKELAIMAGSHNGEPQHVKVVQGILKRIGLSGSYLKCGTQPPLYYTVKGILPRREEKFGVLQHNCSGKHSGMLANCVYQGWDTKDYLNPKHPLHRRILQIISDLCEYPARRIKIGIDGCSAPNFALPVKNMALGFAKLAAAESNSNGLGEILKAMRQYPEMVSGQGRLDFALSQINSGKIVAKAGAEALECLGVIGPDIGLAVRIYDGNNRAVGCVVAEALRQLGLVKNSDRKKLGNFVRPRIKNFANKVVGYIEPSFRLKKVGK